MTRRDLPSSNQIPLYQYTIFILIRYNAMSLGHLSKLTWYKLLPRLFLFLKNFKKNIYIFLFFIKVWFEASILSVFLCFWQTNKFCWYVFKWEARGYWGLKNLSTGYGSNFIKKHAIYLVEKHRFFSNIFSL